MVGKQRFVLVVVNQEGHFSGDKKCPARGRACRKCGVIGHFKVKCPQVQQRSSGELRSRKMVPDKKGATGGGRRGGGNRGGGGGRRERGATRETNLVAGEVKVENLPDLFNIGPNLHFQWNSLLAMGH